MTDALMEEIYGVTREALEGRTAELPTARLSVPHDGRAHGADENSTSGIRSGKP